MNNQQYSLLFFGDKNYQKMISFHDTSLIVAIVDILIYEGNLTKTNWLNWVLYFQQTYQKFIILQTEILFPNIFYILFMIRTCKKVN